MDCRGEYRVKVLDKIYKSTFYNLDCRFYSQILVLVLVLVLSLRSVKSSKNTEYAGIEDVHVYVIHVIGIKCTG